MSTLPKTIRTIARERTPMPEQASEERVRNFFEVALGYGVELALREADRCLDCADPRCLKGCPVAVDIPGFLRKVSQRDYRGAYDVLSHTNVLPAICGRVCPQEDQCEGKCTVGDMLEPVAIGRIERWLGDLAIERGWSTPLHAEKNGFRVGIVGSGPAGIACAADLARLGCDVTIFEALHAPGGVLRYGIPEFRLPKRVIDAELDKLALMGVKIECNTLVGRLFTVEEMIEELGFHAVFIGTGAGLPKFLSIPGESLNGVVSANELLTRCNLMKAGSSAEFDTPLGLGRRVAVIGSGNTAMDALRVARRCGAERVMCVYRRSRAESPARAEELHHAEQEGIEFHWLTNPVAILGDDKSNVRALRCTRMELGEPDDSGRRRPIEVQGSEFELEVDTVVYAIGTSANPIIGQTSGLALNRWGYIQTDESLRTSLAGVYAGGDIVTGSATVILAMGAGRRAARSIAEYLGIGEPEAQADAFGLDRGRHHLVRIRAVSRGEPAREIPAATDLIPAALRARLAIETLRHPFPLVLIGNPSDGRPVRSLRDVFDAALRGQPEQLQQDALRLEARMRVLVHKLERTRAHQAVYVVAKQAREDLLVAAGPEHRERLERACDAVIRMLPNGTLASCTAHGARQLLSQLRQHVDQPRTSALQAEIAALKTRLSELTRSDFMTTTAAWSPEYLGLCLGPGQSADFDLQALSELLTTQRADGPDEPPRSARIRALSEALARPNLFDLDPGAWVFERCESAIEVLQHRVATLHTLLELIERAHLETRVRPGMPPLTSQPWSASLSDALALLPSALLFLDADRLTDVEQARLFELLASGFPIRVVCTSASLESTLRPSALPGHSGVVGGRAALLASLARGLGHVSVVQTALSHVHECLPELTRALAAPAPALIAIYTGEHCAPLPAYLAAAAARAARLFPTLSFDPETARASVAHNPAADACWPEAAFDWESERLERHSTQEAFTAAHLLACSSAFSAYARVLPAHAWSECTAAIPGALSAPESRPTACEPYVSMVDGAGELYRVVVSGPLLEETRRVAEHWANLHRSAAEHAAPPAPSAPAPSTAPARDSGVSVAEAPAAPAAAPSAQAWIDSARCSSCDECIKRSPRMFAYDADKRAVLRDARAGSYRELVEAAEHCKMAVIHPGEPWNPSESGLDALRQRAAVFG